MLHRAATALACMLVVGAPAAALVGGAIPADHSVARHVVLVLGPRGNGRMACTGTAIARDLVLTAAHCLAGASATVVERDDGRRPRLVRVAVAERHPSFDLDTAVARGETADLALLKLAEPLSSQRLPAVLGERTIVLIGERFTVAGYGVTIDGGDSRLGPLRTATLMAVRAPSQRHFQLADPVTRGETAGLGACSGDSGGPVFEDAGGRLIIMGVVSWATSARGGGGCGGLTGATPLAPFREWITETARKMGSKL
jgi:secreted trypsin-like serine protease